MKKHWNTVLWILLPVLFLGLLFARAIREDLVIVQAILAGLLLIDAGVLVWNARKNFRARTLSYGANWAILILLTLGIVGVVNFFAYKNPKKIDVTRGKLNTLSEQTLKVLKGIKEPVKFVYFGRAEDRERNRPLLENYRAANSKIEVETIDALKGALQAAALGIRAENTLIVKLGSQERKLETVTEEKITNALVQMSQGKAPTVCSVTNHGEKDLENSEADGYLAVKRVLELQNYGFKTINLLTEKKAPEACSAVVILGPKSAFFEPEIKTLREYLDAGGRMVVTLELNPRGGEPSPQFLAFLKEYGVESPHAMILDPAMVARNLPADIIPVANLTDHPITEPLKEIRQGYLSAATRPLKLLPAPAGLQVIGLGQSSASSFSKADLRGLAQGKVEIASGDVRGPHTVAAVVSGKKNPQAKRELRLVVIGSTMFATNALAQFQKNIDFFANAVSWTLENEDLISIRPRDEDAGKLELSENAARVIGLVSVFVVPFLVLVAGIVVWISRKRL